MSDLIEKLEYYDSITKQEAVERIEELESKLRQVEATYMMRRKRFDELEDCNKQQVDKMQERINELQAQVKELEADYDYQLNRSAELLCYIEKKHARIKELEAEIKLIHSYSRVN